MFLTKHVHGQIRFTSEVFFKMVLYSLSSLRLLFYAIFVTSVLTIILLLRREPSHGRSYGWLTAEKTRFILNQEAPAQKQFCFKDQFQDILLVVAVLKSHSYSHLPMLKSIYGKYFSNIVFCISLDAPPVPDSRFIAAPLKHGLLAYECLAIAARRFLNQKGYLFTKDDTILNLWKIADFDRTRLWSDWKSHGAQIMFTLSRDQWIWWFTPWGLNACQNAFKELISLNDLYNREVREKKTNVREWDVENSLNALLWNGRGFYRCYRSDINVFYVPKSFAFVFERLSSIFQKHQVFMDIAVPTILRLIQLEGKIIELCGTDIGKIYGEEKAQQNESYFWKHFSYNASYTKTVLFTSTLSENSVNTDILNFIVSELERTNNCRKGFFDNFIHI